MNRLVGLLLVGYGVVALGHLAVQLFLGHLDFRRQRRTMPLPPADWTPTVSLVVTVYNEDLSILHRCLNSIDRQTYPRLEVYVVDDRSSHREGLVDVLEEFAGGRFHVMLSAQNRGKREAQRSVLDEVRGDFIVTTDSDTVLPEGCISALVAPFVDPKIGAVTGDVQVTNKNHNLLTRLISYRYWSAFHQERAAQSFFRVVMCCSGPLSAYRRSVVDVVKDEYVSQVFLGQRCTFGDDRHMTNLVLRENYDVVFTDKAVAHTQVPTTLGGYLRQQVRWNKSFYREMLWTLKFSLRRHAYLTTDLVLQGVLPFMLMFALAVTGYRAATGDVWQLAQYFVVLVGIALLRAGYGVWRTRDIGFSLFLVYGVLHVFVLIPTRLYSLATIGRTHWGTRHVATDRDKPVPRTPAPGMVGYAAQPSPAIRN